LPGVIWRPIRQREGEAEAVPEEVPVVQLDEEVEEVPVINLDEG
jgi:hypothetical protein